MSVDGNYYYNSGPLRRGGGGANPMGSCGGIANYTGSGQYNIEFDIREKGDIGLLLH